MQRAQCATSQKTIEKKGNACDKTLVGFHQKRLKYHARESFFLSPSLSLSLFSVSEKLSFFSTTTDLPDPVTNCTAYNATAYTMQFTCIPGNDGGIKQSFFVEVINSRAKKHRRNFFLHRMVFSALFCRCLTGRRRCIMYPPTNRHFCYESFRATRNSSLG